MGQRACLTLREMGFARLRDCYVLVNFAPARLTQQPGSGSTSSHSELPTRSWSDSPFHPKTRRMASKSPRLNVDPVENSALTVSDETQVPSGKVRSGVARNPAFCCRINGLYRIWCAAGPVLNRAGVHIFYSNRLPPTGGSPKTRFRDELDAPWSMRKRDRKCSQPPGSSPSRGIGRVSRRRAAHAGGSLRSNLFSVHKRGYVIHYLIP